MNVIAAHILSSDTIVLSMDELFCHTCHVIMFLQILIVFNVQIKWYDQIFNTKVSSYILILIWSRLKRTNSAIIRSKNIMLHWKHKRNGHLLIFLDSLQIKLSYHRHASLHLVSNIFCLPVDFHAIIIQQNQLYTVVTSIVTLLYTTPNLIIFFLFRILILWKKINCHNEIIHLLLRVW